MACNSAGGGHRELGRFFARRCLRARSAPELIDVLETVGTAYPPSGDHVESNRHDEAKEADNFRVGSESILMSLDNLRCRAVNGRSQHVSGRSALVPVSPLSAISGHSRSES